jgi:hypothetical protein
MSLNDSKIILAYFNFYATYVNRLTFNAETGKRFLPHIN